jgi:hypothetical protein
MSQNLVILGAGASKGVTKNSFPTDEEIISSIDSDNFEVSSRIIQLGLELVKETFNSGEASDCLEKWPIVSFEKLWKVIDNAFNHLDALVQFGPTNDRLPYKYLKKFSELQFKQARSELEGRHSKLYYSKRIGIAGKSELLINAGWECLMSLVALYAKNFTEQDWCPDVYFSDIKKWDEKIEQSELREHPSQWTIISFNYDTLFERLYIKRRLTGIIGLRNLCVEKVLEF